VVVLLLLGPRQHVAVVHALHDRLFDVPRNQQLCPCGLFGAGCCSCVAEIVNAVRRGRNESVFKSRVGARVKCDGTAVMACRCVYLPNFVAMLPV
jgi:hypothetical protein